MPTADQILDGLHEIADAWKIISILWHVYFGACVMVLASGVRPSRRLAALLLGLPFLSVSASAWLIPNPVNGTVFAVVGVAFLLSAARLPRGSVPIAPQRSLLPGALFFGLGWVYPHFLDTVSFVPYLYAAPVGTVPCPTLIIVIGCLLVLNGLGSRALCTLLGVVGLVYGVMGVAYLDVGLDWVLILGACAILIHAFARTKPHPTSVYCC